MPFRYQHRQGKRTIWKERKNKRKASQLLWSTEHERNPWKTGINGHKRDETKSIQQARYKK